MTETILIAGAGIAGLNAAMALAAPERQVIIIDRDPPPPEGSPEDAFYTWDRKGATQLRHSHVFLGRLVKLIREQHPALWRDLLAAGARESTFEDGLPPRLKAKYRFQPGDEDLSFLFSRRTTLELIMRRHVAGLPGVTFRQNVGIRGLRAEMRDGALLLTGLAITESEIETTIDGDIIVDATGRFTRFPEWLRELGAEIQQEPSPTGILYFTRHYRLRDGMGPPPRNGASANGDLGYIKFAVFEADNRHFSVTLATPEIETELRTAIMRPDIFEKMCAMMPLCARWSDPARSEPVSKVFAMGNLQNVWRRYGDDGKPPAMTFFPIGDAALRTNPLYGRGCSMGAVQAHILAEVLDAERDPIARFRLFESRVANELYPFYEAMAKQDAQAIKRALNEKTPTFKRSWKRRLVESLIEDGLGPATRADITVLRAMMRPFHMLEDPSLWMKRKAILARLLKIWATPKFLKRGLYLPSPGPKRTEALAALGLNAG